MVKRRSTIITVGLTCLLSSCIFHNGEPEKHEDFMLHSDCFVYKNEVEVENFDFGRVEFIDTSKASGCVKAQLKNTYLLYCDTNCIAIYNQHPKYNIKEIENFIKMYQTDTTKLADFIKFDSSLTITVSRLCKDKADNIHFGKYVDWHFIEYSTITKPYRITKNELITTWYKWTE